MSNELPNEYRRAIVLRKMRISNEIYEAIKEARTGRPTYSVGILDSKESRLYEVLVERLSKIL